MGIFDNSGEILSIASPGVAMLAFGLVSLMVIAVMEGIAEMTGLWPISNAMMAFVRSFVDKDLAIIIGIAYWYAYSISFATLIVAATKLATYWSWPTAAEEVTFIAAIPIGLVIVNWAGVKLFGNIEAVMGVLKLLLVI
ncbi:MAG: hypothetical protein M1839_001742 [Geoglossum umbratile]|nr:MAG: hypothetical protein M1839_001742 [Geoglossum umbratile]